MNMENYMNIPVIDMALTAVFFNALFPFAAFLSLPVFLGIISGEMLNWKRKSS